MKSKRIEYIPGVGIDLDKFKNTVIDRTKKRKEIGVSDNDILVLSVGELNINKNHQIILQALAEVGDINIHYAIAGKGDQLDNLERLSYSLGINNQIHLLCM